MTFTGLCGVIPLVITLGFFSLTLSLHLTHSNKKKIVPFRFLLSYIFSSLHAFLLFLFSTRSYSLTANHQRKNVEQKKKKAVWNGLRPQI